MAPPIYTTCVQPQDYEDPALPGGSFWTSLFDIITSGGIGLLARLCDYLLHGKLVCLGGERCAIGRVAEFQTVDDKSGFEKLDNDFSIRILLCPDSLSLMERGEDKRLSNYEMARSGKQGDLITEQPGMPIPREPHEDAKPSARFRGTYVDFEANHFGPPVVYPTSADEPYKVPVLHCEIEGDRIAAVCAVVGLFANPVVDAFCKIPIIGWITCWLMTLVLGPLILSALATAWVAGSNDNRSFDDAGSLAEGDTVVIRGRWVYDAAHAGWNELHPVTSVQKSGDASCTWENFDDLKKRWCDRAQEAPPQDQSAPPGSAPAGIPPEQEPVWKAQVDPANRWIYHPLVDGCGEPVPPPK